MHQQFLKHGSTVIPNGMENTQSYLKVSPISKVAKPKNSQKMICRPHMIMIKRKILLYAC